MDIFLSHLKKWFAEKTKTNTECFSHKLLQIITTYILIDISWVFFRANRFKEGFYAIKSMFSVHNMSVLFDGSIYKCGIDQKTFYVVIFAILVLLIADIFKYKGVIVRDAIAKQNYWFQAFVIAGSFLFILLFGTYGPGFNAGNFIYFQF